MFIKVRNYLAPKFTTEDFRIQVRGPPANYVYGCHMTPVTRGALGYVSYQKGIIQGHLVQRYASKRAPTLLQDRVSDCTFPDCFPILHGHKIYFYGLFPMFLVSMLRAGCYVKQMKSIQFFDPSSVIYMIAQVNSSTIANICWSIQTFKYQCFGFQVYFKSICIIVYNLKTKSEFWSKCPHYIMGCIIKLGSMFFLFPLVLNLTYIDYSLCQILSVYIQYLRCCDHFNKCLFAVNQQAEVLLNIFGECMFMNPSRTIIPRKQWPV